MKPYSYVRHVSKQRIYRDPAAARDRRFSTVLPVLQRNRKERINIYE